MIITCSLIPHGFALAWLAWRTSTSRRSNSSSSNSLSSNSNTAVVVVLEHWSSFTYGRGARVPVSSASCLLCFFLLYGNQLILLIERKHSKIYLSRHMLVGIRALLCCGQIMAIPLHAIRVWQHYNVWLIGLIGGDRRAKPKPKDTILPSFAHKWSRVARRTAAPTIRPRAILEQFFKNRWMVSFEKSMASMAVVAWQWCGHHRRCPCARSGWHTFMFKAGENGGGAYFCDDFYCVLEWVNEYCSFSCCCLENPSRKKEAHQIMIDNRWKLRKFFPLVFALHSCRFRKQKQNMGRIDKKVFNGLVGLETKKWRVDHLALLC